MNIIEGGCTQIPTPPKPSDDLPPWVAVIILGAALWLLFPDFALTVAVVVITIFLLAEINWHFEKKERQREEERREHQTQMEQILSALKRVEYALELCNNRDFRESSVFDLD